MKKIIIVAPISDSLINFRGDLIQDIKDKDCKVIREKWNEHLNGDADWHHSLWNVLIFQAWLENNR